MVAMKSSLIISENPCQSNPCTFGTCEPDRVDYTCECSLGAFGRNCDECKIL